MNERIKILRKEHLKLTLEKFGERIGVTKTAVSRLEKGERSVTDQMFKSICHEFNVNEEWLRDGIEPVFNEADSFSYDDFLKSRKISELESRIVKAYFELPEDIRKTALEHFKKALASAPVEDSVCDIYDEVPDTPEELERLYPPVEFGKADVG